MDSTQVGVFEEAHQIGLACLLRRNEKKVLMVSVTTVKMRPHQLQRWGFWTLWKPTSGDADPLRTAPTERGFQLRPADGDEQWKVQVRKSFIQLHRMSNYFITKKVFTCLMFNMWFLIIWNVLRRSNLIQEIPFKCQDPSLTLAVIKGIMYPIQSNTPSSSPVSSLLSTHHSSICLNPCLANNPL